MTIFVMNYENIYFYYSDVPWDNEYGVEISQN
jgi:hypothetical protein